MKYSTHCIAALPVLTGLTLLSFSCQPVIVEKIPVSIRVYSKADDLSSRVFQEVNHYRMERNAQPVRRATKLDDLAREHANFLRNVHERSASHGPVANHDGFESRARRARFTGYFGQVAENVVSCRSTSPGTLVRLWSKSKSHEITMRNPIYQYAGIGTVIATDGMVFSVQIFGAISS